MSTPFDKNFESGDFIEVVHVKQFADPTNDLESGAALYREDEGTGDAYLLNFFDDPNSTNVVETLEPGFRAYFKAASANTGAATLTIYGSDGEDPPAGTNVATHPLVKRGGDALETGDINAGQVTAVVFTHDGLDGFDEPINPRFEVLGVLSSSGGGLTSPVAIADGGTGATTAGVALDNLGAQAQSDDLDDIAALAPGMGKGDIFVHNGTALTKLVPGSADDGDVLSLDSGSSTGLAWVTPSGGGGGATDLDDLTDVVITGTPDPGEVLRYDGSHFVNAPLDAPDIGTGSVSNTEFGYLDGVTSAIQTQLDNKQGLNAKLTDIAGITLNKGDVLTTDGTNIKDLAVGTNGQVLTADSAAANGIKWATMAASDIGTGSVSNTEFGYLDGVTSAIQTQLDGKQDQADPLDEITALTMTKGDILVHDGTELNKLDVGSNGEVLTVDSAEATGLKWAAAGGGGATDLDDLTDVVITGTPDPGEVLRYDGSHFVNAPLDAPDIGAGTVSNTEFGYLDGVTSAIQTQLDGKQDQADPLDEITALTMTKGDILVHDGTELNKLDVGANGEVLTVDSAEATGLKWAAAGGGGATDLDDLTDVVITGTPDPGEVLRYDGSHFVNAPLDAPDIGTGSVSNTEFGYLDGVTSAIQTQLDNKQGLNAKLTDIAGITLNKGDVLTTDGTNIKDLAVGTNGQVLTADSAATNGIKWATPTSGATDLDGLTDVAISSPASGHVLSYDGTDSRFENMTLSAAGIAAASHTHAQSNITGLVSDLAGKQGLNAKLTDIAGITLNKGDVLTTDGTNIKDLAVGSNGQVLTADSTAANGIKWATMAASDIGAGSVSNTEFGYLDGVTSAIQTQLNGKASSSHSHSASDVTSGTLATARGGTGLSTFTGTGRLLYSSSSSALTALAAGSAGQVLTMSGGVPVWDDAPLTGSGSNLKITMWTGSNALAYSTALGWDASNLRLVVNDITSDTGDNLVLYRAGSVKAELRSDRTYIKSVRNQGLGQLMYWDTSGTGEIVYQFSRGAHKEDVKKVEMSIDDLMRWRPVEFKWKEKFGGSQDVGLIAEEVASVYPLAATYDQPWEYLDDKTGEYSVDEEGMPKRLAGDPVVAGVKYEKAWIPMLAAVQDFYMKFKEEQAKTARLEARLSVLEGAK